MLVVITNFRPELPGLGINCVKREARVKIETKIQTLKAVATQGRSSKHHYHGCQEPVIAALALKIFHRSPHCSIARRARRGVVSCGCGRKLICLLYTSD